MRHRRQVALLRGVNVGGRSLDMPQLRDALSRHGHRDVRTLLRSGNVVLSSSLTGAALTETLERQLADAFGFAIPVVVRDRDELTAVIARDPLRAVVDNPARYQVTFLAKPLPPPVARELAALEVAPEAIVVTERELYTWHPSGIGRSPLAEALNRLRGQDVVATSRNWNTVEKLLGLADTG